MIQNMHALPQKHHASKIDNLGQVTFKGKPLGSS